MTPDEAAEFAARILKTIDAARATGSQITWESVRDADRERVAYFLRAIARAEEGLRACANDPDYALLWEPHVRRYTEERDEAWANLDRTGLLYGVRRVGPYVLGPEDSVPDVIL